MYPDDIDIRMAKNSVKAMRKIHPRAIYDMFLEHVYPFKEKIMNRDERFFLEMDYTEFGGDSMNVDISIVMNLKKYWTTLSPATKENMWLYFAILIKLCEKVGEK